MAKYSKEFIVAKIDEYNKAETKLLSGKSYRIGTRELTRMDLSEIQKGRSYWENELKKLENGGRRTSVRRVIPIDS